MLNKNLLLTGFAALLVAALATTATLTSPQPLPFSIDKETGSSTDDSELLTSKVSLPLPYTSQIPDGRSVAPWSVACEEASITMVEQYYLGNRSRAIPRAEAKNSMLPLFRWEDGVFGFNHDTNAAQTARIINEYSSFKATVTYSPTLEDIKQELRAGRPVITLHDGRGLNNRYIKYSISSRGYHMIVLKGFDDTTQEFITHDPGTSGTRGLDYRYSYDTIMNTLHDFNDTPAEPDYYPPVIFTAPKIFAREIGTNGVYLIENGMKRPIAHTGLFQKYRWNWKAVQKVNPGVLATIPDGAPVNE
ncbi:MAG TPA: C39 family peptidase [Patescibacteria group bacterium]|nr:C39 family peptidase [Patescibacteria group bacterium]